MSDRLILPVLPLRDVVLFPGVTAPIGAGRPMTIKAIEAALATPEKLVFAVAQRENVEQVASEGLYRVGTIKASELGGLYRTMPWTAGFCIVGSASISAFPLLSGFVTKSMILSAALEDGRWVAYVLLLVASAAVVDHSGIKVPFFAFFSHDSGKRPKEAPANMLAAMGLAAALCLAIGLYPQPLYDLLPHPVAYSAFTGSHLLTQLQLLLFAVAGFVFLYRRGWYPVEVPAINLDSDWTYRWLLPRTWWRGAQVATRMRHRAVPLRDRIQLRLRLLQGGAGREPPGPGVPSHMIWRPLLTFEQVLMDLPLASSTAPGYGHDYDADVPRAWLEIIRPHGWERDRTERMLQILDP